jgi:hypothetical protein
LQFTPVHIGLTGVREPPLLAANGKTAIARTAPDERDQCRLFA